VWFKIFFASLCTLGSRNLQVAIFNRNSIKTSQAKACGYKKAATRSSFSS